MRRLFLHLYYVVDDVRAAVTIRAAWQNMPDFLTFGAPLGRQRHHSNLSVFESARSVDGLELVALIFAHAVLRALVAATSRLGSACRGAPVAISTSPTVPGAANASVALPSVILEAVATKASMAAARAAVSW